MRLVRFGVGLDQLQTLTAEYIAPGQRRSERQTERDLFDEKLWVEEEDVEPEAEALAEAADADELLTAMVGGDVLEASSGVPAIEIAKLRPRSGWPKFISYREAP